MILTFKVFLDKIKSGEKCHTIRPYNEKRYRMLCNAKKYQLYWHNPRNGGKLIKATEPDGAPIRIFFMEPNYGNESIITALRKSLWWMCYWYREERGGHFWFKIKRLEK